MWDPPRPGLKPVSPALAGGFLTTVLIGKSQVCLLTSKKSSRNQSIVFPKRKPLVGKRTSVLNWEATLHFWEGEKSTQRGFLWSESFITGNCTRKEVEYKIQDTHLRPYYH